MNTHAKSVIIISLLILLVMLPIAVMNKVYGWIPDIIIFMVVILFYYWVYDTFRMNVPILTLIIIGHILHLCGIFGWYNVSPVPIQWDHVTHFFGAFPFALLFFRFMEQWMTTKWFTKKNLLIIMAIFLAATGVGAVVELSEFVGYLTLGYGDGALMFGDGDGVTGLAGDELIDAIGGGWINEGWDFIYNTLGIIAGMIIMIAIKLVGRKSKPAYYFEEGKYSKRIR